jgi:hypothetical protein
MGTTLRTTQAALAAALLAALMLHGQAVAQPREEVKDN